jgi:agmatine deiminase
MNTPEKLGFAMPAEWEPHAATWMAWPYSNELWLGFLDAVRQDFAGLVRAVSHHEPVHLLVRDEEVEQDARSRLEGCDVTFHRHAYNDVWLRDSGPIFVTRGAPGIGEVAPVDWEFNGWGNKFAAELDNAVPKYISSLLGTASFRPGIVMEGGSLDVNGAGACLTTEQCLLSPERNPGRSKMDLETVLQDYLGLDRILWLGDGLENDHTDGHIDTITRFASERVIVTAICEDQSDPNYAVMNTNLEKLRSFTDADGRPFEIVTLPLPQNRLELTGDLARAEGLDGDRLAATYCNFYIINGAVIVPVYDDPNDDRALEILRLLFPDRQVIGLSSRGIITGGGSFHCVTQQQPVGQIWKAQGGAE